MDLIMFLVLCVAIYGLQIPLKQGNTEYLSHKNTTAVNGIFVMLVFLRHFSQYIQVGKFEAGFHAMDILIDQLLVTTFLFYSGYGIIYSLMNKEGYESRIPRRFLKIYLQYLTVVCFFFFWSIHTGTNFGTARTIGSFFAWDNIGNSNWYILVILCLYLFVYLGAKLFPQKYVWITCVVIALACIYIGITYFFEKGSWYYNTILCYPAGMLYGIYHGKIDSILNSQGKRVAAILVILVCFIVSYYWKSHSVSITGIFATEARSICFVLLVVCVTRCVRFGNPILDWLGKYTFELYILQRIPLVVLYKSGMKRYVIFVLCVILTMVMSIIYKWLINKICQYIRGGM